MNKYGKAAVLAGPKKVEIREFPLPQEIPEDCILARLEMCGVCGTDVHSYKGRFNNYPSVLGHETVGIIEKIGSKAAETAEVTGKRLQKGDRIVWPSSILCNECYYCRWSSGEHSPLCERRIGYGGGMRCDKPPYFVGGYAEFIYLLPGAWVYKISDSLPTEIAVLVDTLSSARGVDRGFKLSEEVSTVVIQGSGTIGVMAAVRAKNMGAHNIIMTGAPEFRLELARKFGVDYVIDISIIKDPSERIKKVKELTNGRGVDMVVECTGVPSAFPEGLEMLRRAGTFVEIGHYTDGGDVVVNPFKHFCHKDLILVAQYGVAPHQYKQDLLTLEERRFPYEQLVTHKFKIEEAALALETASNFDCMKAVIMP